MTSPDKLDATTPVTPISAIRDAIVAAVDTATVLRLLMQYQADWAPQGWLWLTRIDGIWQPTAGDVTFEGDLSTTLPTAWMAWAKTAGWRAYPSGDPAHTESWLWVKGEAQDEIACCATVALGGLLARQHAAHLQAIQDAVFHLATLAATEVDLTAFLRQVHELINRLVYAENFFVALYDPGRRTLRFPYFVDVQDPDVPDPNVEEPFTPGDLSPTGWVIHHGDALLIDKAELRARQAAGSLTGSGPSPEYWMGAPLRGTTGDVIGVIAVQTYRPGHRYDQDEQRLFLLTSQHVALALERLLRRALLEAEVARRTEELTRLNAQLQCEVAERNRAEKLQHALYQIAELTSQPTDMAAFYKQLHTIISGLVYAKNCYIALYDENEDLVTFPYYVDERVPTSPPRKSRRGLTEYVIRQRRSVLLNNAGAMQLLHEGEVQFVSVGGGEDATWWLGTPLFTHDRVVGVIVIQTYEPDMTFGEYEVGLMNFVSHHISTALARKRAADALKQAYQELEQRVLERTQDLDAANAQLQYENLHDALTGLANRTQFMQALHATWTAAQQGKASFVVAFADLDRFKSINDTFGHAEGDFLLIEASQRLLHCLRSHDLLARLGGDEFAMLLPGIDDAAVAEQIAQRICEQFDQPIILGERPVFTSCSIGIVVAKPGQYSDPQQLLGDADAAMYQAKSRGRDGYVVFNQALREEIGGVLEQEVRFRNALKQQDEIVAFMQPIVDGENGCIVAFEALMRWRSAEGGWTLPAQLLALAENSRLITRLDCYMLEWICRWLSSVPADWPPVHLNCSSLSLIQPNGASIILDTLTRFGVAPHRLQIEVTEGALLADATQASLTMATLQSHGVKVVLDDFGTGYASLSYLHSYHFDAVKIDKSFILSLESEPKSAAIVSSVLLLAQAMHLDVVAEGVETADMLQLLNKLGTMKLQGYLFARPMPVEQIDLPMLAARIKETWLRAEELGGTD